jgi:TPR repeat protein
MAFAYFKKASDASKTISDLRSADADLNLGVMYFGGLGTSRDLAKALHYFTSAFKHGSTFMIINVIVIISISVLT